MPDQAQPQPQPAADSAIPDLAPQADAIARFKARVAAAIPGQLTITAAPDALTEGLVLANSTVQLAILVISSMPPAEQAAAWQAHEERMTKLHDFLATVASKVRSIGPPMLSGNASQ